jgi:predicted TIM-barrel fold metal-dependent hydrolase
LKSSRGFVTIVIMEQHARQYRVISADGHFNEPGDLFTSRVSASLVDRVPRIVPLEEGDAWVMEGWDGVMPFGWGSCAGRPPDQHGRWIRFEDMRAGSYDPKARIEEMDLDNIDAEVLFPSAIHQWVTAARDDQMHLEMVRAYNDFVSEFCAIAPDRLGGVAMIPSRGADTALAEIERTLAMPGFVGFLLKCYPNGTLEIEPEDDAVWEAIEASGRPLTIHVGLGNTMPTELKARSLPGTVHFYDAPNRMLQFIFSGVLDRFPGLTIVMTEVDCGWLPYFAEQADDNFMRHIKSSLRDHQLTKLPSEYMAKHFPATFITDHYALDNRERIGVDRLLWSNDYPHITSDWPYSWKTINAAFAGIPTDERHAILAGNAQRIFGFGG